MSQPVAILLAGPNGAGKTTTALTLFRETLPSVRFVNADIIAPGLAGNNPDSVALQAGGIMLERLHALADERADFAFETTGASVPLRLGSRNLLSRDMSSIAIFSGCRVLNMQLRV
ncbi:MAG TPA: hypothetical protein VHM90_12435 [Phycisphaerae bacterium]|nr:hypothetical protein [Phycisphaerae bacterium]